MTILNAVIDLVSFSEILYTIYPPLFVVLVVYSVGGTAISIKLGQKLVGLNFQQEAQEANYRSAGPRATCTMQPCACSCLEPCASYFAHGPAERQPSFPASKYNHQGHVPDRQHQTARFHGRCSNMTASFMLLQLSTQCLGKSVSNTSTEIRMTRLLQQRRRRRRSL